MFVVAAPMSAARSVPVEPPAIVLSGGFLALARSPLGDESDGERIEGVDPIEIDAETTALSD